MATTFPAGNPGNTYVPNFEASGRLTVAYSRNVKDFPLNKYTTLVPVRQLTGYYLRITPDNIGRITQNDGGEFVWPDGNDAPQGDWNLMDHEFFTYLATRYTYPFRLGYLSVDQGAWDILATHQDMAANQAMRFRTKKVITKLETASTWSGVGHTAAASATWDTGTSTNPVIKKDLHTAAISILKDTMNAVQPKDLILVISHELAELMSRSQEIHTYLKESPYALAQIRGDVESQNGKWGLPDQLYGYNIVIEDTYIETAKVGAASSKAAVKDKDNALLIARPGGLVGIYGGASFSTCSIFSQEEMTVEQKDDVDNRRYLGRVVDTFGVEVVSPISGYFITNTYP